MDVRLSFLLTTVALVFALGNGKAIFKLPVDAELEPPRESDLVDYLAKYGYLTRPDPRTSQLTTADELKAAVKKLQHVVGYEETGDISDGKTLSIVKRKRCGMPDFGPSDNVRRKRRYALHGTSWNKLDLTYRIENYTPDLSKEDVDRTIEKALEMWSNASGLTFKREDDFTVEPDISIKFVLGYHGDGRPTDGPGKELAHAFFPLDNKGVAGDLHFDEDETFTLNGEDGTNLLWLAVHELGHSLGLEHTFFPDSIMFPYYTGYQPNLKLDMDDVQAVQALYGLPDIERPTPTLNPSPTDGSHKKCDVKLDAIVMTADETTYAFSGSYFWEIGDYGAGEAKEIKAFWPDLEENIDAAYTIRAFGHTIFFKGSRFWVYQNQKKFYGPGDISELEIPKELANMDAALEWRRNGKAYFFKGDKYWRYDRTRGKIDDGYPRPISAWRGIPENIDAVFQWKNGRSYFFKGNDYYAFDDDKLQVLQVEESNVKPYPRDLGTYWMGCSEQNVVISPDRSAAYGLLPNLFIFALSFLLAWAFELM